MQNVRGGKSAAQYGDWVSFDSTTLVLYPPSATDGRGVWSLVPAGGSFGADVYYIQNMWHGSAEHRYHDWVSFTGDTMELIEEGDLANKVPWKLVPTGAADTYNLQNLWGGSSERRYGMWASFNGTQMNNHPQMVLSAAGDAGLRGAFKFATVAPPRAAAYCTSAFGVPEQVNLQLASSDSIVVGWITFERQPPSKPPTVFARLVQEHPAAGGDASTASTGAPAPLADPEGAVDAASADAAITGVTHVHVTQAGDRTYYMHFCELSGLRPRATYAYAVQSGAPGSALSQSFTFRAPYANGATRIDIFGDMGCEALCSVLGAHSPIRTDRFTPSYRLTHALSASCRCENSRNSSIRH
jgi:hypothetical protein